MDKGKRGKGTKHSVNLESLQKHSVGYGLVKMRDMREMNCKKLSGEVYKLFKV